MACEVISSPFHETSGFEAGWQQAAGEDCNMGDLSMIAEFNASCDNSIAAFDGNATTMNSIDPQLLSSPAASPDSSSNPFDQAFTNQNDFAYPDFNQPTPANTPYFQQPQAPIAPAVTMFASSPLRNQLHRRSVSEPPDNLPHHHPQFAGSPFVPAGPPMVLTRGGYFIGQPKPQQGGLQMVKSLPKNKQYRSQPYASKHGLASTPQAHGNRYNFCQPRPQPVHAHTIGPTSMPQDMLASNLPPPPPQPMQHTQTTSRVCTPAPSPMNGSVVGSPGPIDSMRQTQMLEKKVVAIPYDELKRMIEDVVRKAVEGVEAAKKTEADQVMSDAAHAGAENNDEDEIVVASVEKGEDDLFGESIAEFGE